MLSRAALRTASRLTVILTRIDLRSIRLSARQLAQALPRAALDVTAAQTAVAPLIENVRRREAAALRSAAERFDGVRPVHLHVPAAAITQALDDLDPAVREALELSIAHNRAGHAAQVPAECSTEVAPGGTIVQCWIPVERVGLYVPGGLAVYPSSVVMNAVTAQVAGVEQVALASPPQAEFAGLPRPAILAACALLGIIEVYTVDGAQAIAMLAYGADAQDDIDRADAGGEVLCRGVGVITGPGNIYVAAAKRAVMGTVGIDAEAGPTKIAILADAGADPEYVTADLLSQAEYDPNVGNAPITDPPQPADAVDAALERKLSVIRHRERVSTALRGPQSETAPVRDLAQAIEAASAYAAEHLEIHASGAPGVARRVHNARAIFVGPYNPVSLGNYLTGSNHVLPIGGTTRLAAGLSVMVFLRPAQLIGYSANVLGSMTPALEVLASCEDLPAYGEAIRARRQ